jgi:hypothetical protein
MQLSASLCFFLSLGPKDTPLQFVPKYPFSFLLSLSDKPSFLPYKIHVIDIIIGISTEGKIWKEDSYGNALTL